MSGSTDYKKAVESPTMRVGQSRPGWRYGGTGNSGTVELI